MFPFLFILKTSENRSFHGVQKWNTSLKSAHQAYNSMTLCLSKCFGIIHSVYVHKYFRKTNIFYPLIRKHTCAYQKVRNVAFSENFAYVLNEWSLSENCIQVKWKHLTSSYPLSCIIRIFIHFTDFVFLLF